MITKYKEQIKGAILSTGIWIIILNLFPSVYNWYLNVNSSIMIGIGLALVALVFWK